MFSFQMNNALAGNPAVLGQLRQQLEIISDMIRQGQGGGGQEEATAGQGGGAAVGGGGMGGDAVVLDMMGGMDEIVGLNGGPADEAASSNSSGASEDDQDESTDQQPVADADSGPDNDANPLSPNAAAAGTLNAEVRRIRELVRSPEIQRVRFC